MKFSIFACLAATVLTGCSASPESGTGSEDPLVNGKKHGGGGVPGGSFGTTPDHGAPSSTFPAFTPDVAQLVNNGGAVLKKPRIVTITWASDPNGAAYEDFGDKIGDSAYWRAAVSEYGVGPASSGADNHLRIGTAPPATATDDSLEQLIATNVENAATSGWPAWTAETIYILYVREGIKVTTKATGKDACEDAQGYHTEVDSGGKKVIYAIVNENCRDVQNNQSVVDYSTSTAAHELGEASTNPHVTTDEAWDGFDSDHQGYEIFQKAQSEDGDACEFFDDSEYTESEQGFAFRVQRMWSNKSAASGHNPCVPVDGKPFFNVTPLDLARVSSLLPSHSTVKTRGVRVPVGDTKTVALGFYSDGKTAPWSISAAEGDGMSTPKTKHLEVTLDKTTGENGEKAVLSVHARSLGPKRGTIVTLVSTLEGTTHYMPVLVQTN